MEHQANILWHNPTHSSSFQEAFDSTIVAQFISYHDGNWRQCLFEQWVVVLTTSNEVGRMYGIFEDEREVLAFNLNDWNNVSDSHLNVAVSILHMKAPIWVYNNSIIGADATKTSCHCS